MNLEKLLNNKNWKVAVIVFDKSNFKDMDYSKLERSYRVTSDNNYFKPGSISKSLFGDCTHDNDFGVRLDVYNWMVESIEIIGGIVMNLEDKILKKITRIDKNIKDSELKLKDIEGKMDFIEGLTHGSLIVYRFMKDDLEDILWEVKRLNK